MIAIKRKCLDQQEMQLVISGRLPQSDFDSAISHLDGCTDCQRALEDCQSNQPPSLDGISDPELDPLQSETACQVALHKMLESSVPTLDKASSSFVPCQTLGPYELVTPLGQGGMGTVYLAHHQRLKRKCAIKLLPRERVDQPGWLDRFDREMRTVASLEHPHVVRATDAGHESGWHYLVMEHLDGLDLSQVAARMGQLSVDDACEIIRQAALGLAHVHDAGLVHRDIKPSNLMLTQQGVVKLLDLGLVLPGDDPLAVDDRLTTVGHVMGTMPYMAPEQLSDSRHVNPLSDIYSLGATLYRLIAGKPPHGRQKGLAAQVLAITAADPPPLDTIREDVDRQIVDLVSEMLSRDPSKRPTSASEVAKRLEAIGKPGKLKGLIRQASRRTGTDANAPMSLIPSIQQAGGGDRSGNWRHWLAGAAAMGALLIAALVIKIQTDRGELVVHSDQEDLVVLIKRGDEVIDRLEVDSPGDHRTVLSKGTYRVEIQGGGKALVLSDDVVTIGRSTTTPLTVFSKAVESVSSEEIAVKETPSASGEIASSLSDPADLAMNPGGSEEGAGSMMGASTQEPDKVARLVSQIETETDLDALGEAMVAATNLVAPQTYMDGMGGMGGGMGGGVLPSDFTGKKMDDMETISRAMMKRAREFGGVHVKIPPPPNSNAFSVTPSEHFMWYLMECLPRLQSNRAQNVLASELQNGNGQSRAAILTCWYSGTIMPPQPRHVMSQWIRTCSALIVVEGNEAAWESLPPEDRQTAASYAYAFLLNNARTYGIDPMTIPTFAKAIREKSPEELSTVEKEFLGLAKPPNKSPMGMDESFDEMDMMSYGDDMGSMQVESGTIPNAAKDAPAVFKGRPLADWLVMLKGEQDANSLGEAVLAVEILTRNSNARTGAASETLKLTRRLGGMIQGSMGRIGDTNHENPSHRFMAYFVDVFPRYLPEPGLEVLAQELRPDEGNTKSHMAIVRLLHVWLTEYQADNTIALNERALLESLDREEAERLTQQMIEDLLRIADEFSDIEDAADPQTTQYAADEARSVALKLLYASGRSILDHDELVPWFQKQLEPVLKQWKNTGTGVTAGQALAWQNPLIEEAGLNAAVDLTSHQGAGPDTWRLYAKHLLEQHQTLSEASEKTFDLIVTAAPMEMVEAIQNHLSVITEQVQPGSNTYAWNHPLSQNSLRTPWKKALPFFAENSKAPQEALNALQSLKSKCEAPLSPFQGKIIPEFEAAMKTLSERVKQNSPEQK